ncbi:hypothetical protein K3495_g7885 [Podosphaera aphanis]|nr:hypothetical protein K3495_g7885 [Podosphaera aphanis]
MASESPAPSDSPLSIISSDPFATEADGNKLSTMPPTKRRKLGESAICSLTPPKLLDEVSISSDSSGDVPHSPNHQRNEEDEIHEQVTVCRWAECNAGDLINMDNLVAHIHEYHVETRSKKYICEWNDCGRKNMPHPSAYALKAHMRSHTKEKPFYCELPECDRSFTRSDALQKHYRTVHETEALRPSDPIPKSMQSSNKTSKQKSISKTQRQLEEEVSSTPVDGMSTKSIGCTTPYPSELGFTAMEEDTRPKELYRLLRRQVHWAEEEAEILQYSCHVLEDLRKKEWLEKEILLDQALKVDINWQERRRIVLSQHSELPSVGTKIRGERAVSKKFISTKFDYSSPGPTTQIKGQPVEREAAAVLASLQKS